MSDYERERQPDDIEITISNMYGSTLHFLMPQNTAVDIFRGISESSGLYSLQIECSSGVPMEAWREEYDTE